MRVTVRLAGALTLALLGLAACGEAGSPDAAAAPQDALDRAADVLRAKGSGRVLWTTTSDRESGGQAVTRFDTVFDLTSRRWQSVYRYELPGGSVVMDMAGEPGVSYLRAWAAADKPWMGYRDSVIEISDAEYMSLYGMLDAATATQVIESPGVRTVEARVPAGYALRYLRLSTGLPLAKRSVDMFSGHAVIRVEIDPTGAPTKVTLDGGSLEVTPALPEFLAAAATVSEFVGVISDLGTPAEIAIPRDVDLLTAETVRKAPSSPGR